MTTNSQLSAMESKTKQNKTKLSKQLEQEQSHRDEDHKEDCQWVRVGGEWEKWNRG